MKPAAAALPAIAAIGVGLAVSVPSMSATSADSATRVSCTAAQLRPGVAAEQGATGHLQMVIALHNLSATSCHLTGYPGLRLLDAHDKPMTTKVVDGGTYDAPSYTPRTVTLQPGGVASFAVAWDHIPGSTGTSCPAAQKLAILPPGSSDHLTIDAPVDACGGVVHVSAIARGSNGPS
ncbi:MAG TPA: DUF4232 domain-containing protein [Mycobacteriales bacterium]|jgi:hypothetical protein|nr:DUF4232 domain-containing protein [Mycobacteriales bacterium]